MGEEGKKENGGGHSVQEGKEKEKENNHDKQDNKYNNNDEIIVIKVDMHCQCQACAKKIAKSLRTSPGVEDVAVDRKTSTVVVKGKTAEPTKLCDRIRHKTGRSAHLLSPLPKQPQPPPKDDGNKDHQQQQNVDKAPPVVLTVVLGVHMHCEACAQLLRKRIRKMKGVESVETDAGKGEVKVKGIIEDPEILVKYVHNKTRKQVSLLSVISASSSTPKKDDNEEKGKGQPYDNSGHKLNKADDKTKQQDNVGDNTTTTTTTTSTTSIDHINNDHDDAKMMRMRMLMMGDMNRFQNFNNWPSQLQSQSQSPSPSSRYDYRMEYHPHPPNPRPQPHHYYDNDYDYGNNNNNPNYQPHQMFSDGNPDACSIM